MVTVRLSGQGPKFTVRLEPVMVKDGRFHSRVEILCNCTPKASVDSKRHQHYAQAKLPVYHQYCYLGQPLHLRCCVEGAPFPAIKWYKDGVDVDTWVLNKDVVTKLNDEGWCELFNPEAYPEDSGEYRCIATNRKIELLVNRVSMVH